MTDLVDVHFPLFFFITHVDTFSAGGSFYLSLSACLGKTMGNLLQRHTNDADVLKVLNLFNLYLSLAHFLCTYNFYAQVFYMTYSCSERKVPNKKFSTPVSVPYLGSPTISPMTVDSAYACHKVSAASNEVKKPHERSAESDFNCIMPTTCVDGDSETGFLADEFICHFEMQKRETRFFLCIELKISPSTFFLDRALALGYSNPIRPHIYMRCFVAN